MNERRAATPPIAGYAKAGTSMKEVLRIASWRRASRRDIRPLSRLLPYVLAHRTQALLGVFFLVVSAGAMLALTGGARRIVDRGFEIRTTGDLLQEFSVLGAIVAVLALATGLRLYFVHELGERVAVALRRAVFEHVLTLDLGLFQRIPTGEILSRLTTDMTLLERLVGNVAPVALRNIVMLSGALGLMILVSPNFAGLVLILIPLLLTPLFLYSRRLRTLSLRAQDRFAEAVGYAAENLEALEAVQAFGREATVSARFKQAVDAAFEAAGAQIRAHSTMQTLLIAFLFGGMLVVLFQCAAAVFVTHTMSAGVLLQLLILTMIAASAVKDLGEAWGEVQKAAGASERVMQLLELRPAIAAPLQPIRLPVPARGEIAFENVVFTYPGRPEIASLNGFSLHVRPGERVALVGPSGAGKSTVLRLLLRFYDPQSGVVRLDGVDLTRADPREVRERMALVAQEAPLFSGSGTENILFGSTTAGAEEARTAALAAQAEGFLSALPQGFDTPLGERAKTLSGGQRQRLAIARALVRTSPILLLDEATSALDAENERLVQQAVHDAMSGRTTLVIAHRLATVLQADRIVVMDQGRVVEEGTHAELIARGGLYARLARLQFGVDREGL
jgi:ATP-binding cassette subfamily B protein